MPIVTNVYLTVINVSHGILLPQFFSGMKLTCFGVAPFSAVGIGHDSKRVIAWNLAINKADRSH